MKSLFTISILLPCFLQGVVIDNFTDLALSTDYNSLSSTSTDHIHNNFIDSKGNTIGVNRSIAEYPNAESLDNPYDSYFTPTLNNLHYNCSVPKPANYIAPNEIVYSMSNQWDMTNTPILKINLSSFSNPFLIDISLVNYGSSGIENIMINDFSINSLNTNIDILTYGGSNIDISNVTNIKFLMNNGSPPIPNLTFDISSIEAVPEPFSIIGLGTGISALIKKRKFR